MNIFLQIKKRLTGKNANDVAATEEALQSLDQELEEVQTLLRATRAKYGDSLIAGATPEAERIEQAVQDRERMLHRLQVARAAVAERLIHAKAEHARSEQASRWDDTRKALAKRRDAFVALEKATDAFAAAYREAEAAARAAYEVLPVRTLPGNGASARAIGPEYADLSREANRLLSIATAGRVGTFSESGLWEIQKQPGLVERADQAANEWLSLSESPNTPEAA